MNEPQPGSTGSTPAANGYQASSQDLYPFYTRAIEALTGVRDGRPTCPAACADVADRLVCLPAAGVGEPPADLLRALGLPEPGRLLPPGVRAVLVVPEPRLRAPRVHLRLHRGAGPPWLPAKPGGYPPNFTFGYQTAEAEAQAMHSAVFVTEFGDSSATDSTILANELAAQEATQTGARSGPGRACPRRRDVLVRALAALELPDDRQRHAREGQSQGGAVEGGPPHRQPAAPPHARVADGHRRAAGCVQLRPVDRTFAMVATSTAPAGAVTARPTPMVFIPSTVHGAVHVSGAAALDAVVTRPDGSRLAYVTTTLPDARGEQRRPLRRHRRPGVEGPDGARWPTKPRARCRRSASPWPAPRPRAALTAEAHSPERLHPLDGAARGGPGRHRLGSTDPNGPPSP